MRLVNPEAPAKLLWDGELELATPIGAQRGTRERGTLEPQPDPATIKAPLVSIGQPEVWRLEELYDGSPPAEFKTRLDEFRFFLARFVCSFRMRQKDTTLDFARFVVKLLKDADDQQALAYDLYPKTVVQERKKSLSITLSPSVKFSEVEASIGSADFALEYQELVPVISTAGAGEAVADWSYEGVQGIPLVGSKWMHMVIRAPIGMKRCDAQLGISADVRARTWLFGAHLKKQGYQSGLGVRLW
jgi:hypothetical protein